MQTGRRTFIKHALAGGVTLTGLAGILQSRQAPAAIAADSLRPMAQWGLQIGDVVGDRAIVWSRADKPARMFVEWSRDQSFASAVTLRGPHALDVTDLTARIDLTNLPADRDVFVRATFEDLDSGRARSEPVLGRLRTPPAKRRDVRFVWSGDTCGQGWGIDLGFGGMKIYEAMRRVHPDFFIHSGDTIYADGVIPAEVKLEDGAMWKN
ncbi:MAG TPA: PhoD-like phosphatase N-terminal domain-containing protein, partial [Rhodanobacteraceae bacterium]